MALSWAFRLENNKYPPIYPWQGFLADEDDSKLVRIIRPFGLPRVTRVVFAECILSKRNIETGLESPKQFATSD